MKRLLSFGLFALLALSAGVAHAQLISTPLAVVPGPSGTASLQPIYPLSYTAGPSASWPGTPPTTVNGAIDALSGASGGGGAPSWGAITGSPSASSSLVSYVAAQISAATTAIESWVYVQLWPGDVWVDFNPSSGNDTTGSGSPYKPWHSIQKACNVITPSLNFPATIHLAGDSGNNDPDTGTITCPPNLALVSDTQIQVIAPFVLTGSSNDNFTATNIEFISAFTWVRNDNKVLTVNFNNTALGGVLTLQQQNSAGGFILNMGPGSSIDGTASLQLPNYGAFFNDVEINTAVTFADENTAPYYEILGGYIGAPVSFSGGVEVYFSGVQADVPFGYTLTAVTTGNGTPTFQADAGSIPPTITGTPTLVLTSYAQHESYTPSVSSAWSSTPLTVKQAIDAHQFAQQSAVGSQPACTSTLRGLQWLIQSTSGVADIFQLCQQTIAGYAWVTH